MENSGFASQIRCLKGTSPERKACRAACTLQTCPMVLSYWGYRPSIPENGTFAVFMGIFSLAVLAIAMEVLGFIARIYANSYPFSDLSFITQLTCLTLAPAFYAAGIYFSLQKIVLTFGGQNSRIPPMWIPRIFIGCDVVSLFLQGGGGAWAASLAQNEKMPDPGNYTMIAGLTFQAFTLLLFLALSTDFAMRMAKAKKRDGASAMNEDPAARRLRQSKRFKYLIYSLAISAVLIFLRSVYRVAELSEGWKGELMSTEKYVMWFESLPVTAAGLLLTIFHPGYCFKEEPSLPEFIPMPPSPDRPRQPLHTIRRWNDKTGKCEVEVIYDTDHPALRHLHSRQV
ncbi:hypothetical protein BLS_004341 [Venturia inaequalis]|uniref:Uncharacterized protein n=1 Tax=Venturia inaequalis TaxID=5025 RepID=A0A8H3YS91_VENIN|nr:hypothetical protein BLS_004341 [Venturia inaequalis]